MQIQQIAEAVWLQLGRELAASQSLETTLEIALRFVRNLVPTRTSAIFVYDGTSLRSQPPGLTPTPWVERAWRVNQVIGLQGEAQASELVVPGERWAVACPLEGQGVLYLGRLERGFSDEERHLIISFATQLSLGLLSARRFQENLLVQGQMMHSSKLVAIGQLAAGVAHELNTPLGAATLQLELAQELLDPEQKVVLRKLGIAQRALAQCQGIISRLLYYAREGASSRENHDLNQILRDTLELLQKPLTDAGLELSVEEGSVAPVYVNAGEIQQVITNLVLNAKDACVEPGALARQVSLRTGADAQGVYLQVLDRGAGLSAEAAARMFEPFFTTKPQGQGMGLGLSVSKEIVDQHKGRLTATPRPDGGACFLLALPHSDWKQEELSKAGVN